MTFQTTPVMSTYLLAFCVGEFDFIEADTPEGVTVRCWTPVGKKEQGTFALDTAVGSLSFFGEYFDSPYPLPKMDMVAVPDFSAGAMENWGLVVYRASLMLYEEGKTPVNAKQRIGYVVGHELAHQWFGNLVTMEWWSQLWLNEGFATWVGWRAMDHLYPEWRVWSQFLVNEQSMGLGLDSLRSSHPVEVPIASAAQVTEIFDAISYSKGSCVIRMLESHLGEATFREGMRLYVRRHAYANAGTTDLWQALSEASGEDVAGLMSCWTAQTGYPILTVASSPSDGQDTVVSVSQRRYLASGPDSLDENENAATWKVPLRAGDAFAASVPDLLETDAVVFDVSDAQRDKSAMGALKLNLGQSGFYRVAYDASERARLKRAIPNMDEVDRVGIVSGRVRVRRLGVRQHRGRAGAPGRHRADASYVVWSDVASGLGGLTAAFFEQPEETAEALGRSARTCSRRSSSDSGGKGETRRTKRELTRTRTRRSFCVSSRCARARVRGAESGGGGEAPLDAYAAGDASAVPADLRGAVFAAALRGGGAAEFEQLKALYESADSSLEESLVLGAMGASKDADIIEPRWTST